MAELERPLPPFNGELFRAVSDDLSGLKAWAEMSRLEQELAECRERTHRLRQSPPTLSQAAEFFRRHLEQRGGDRDVEVRQSQLRGLLRRVANGMWKQTTVGQLGHAASLAMEELTALYMRPTLELLSEDLRALGEDLSSDRAAERQHQRQLQKLEEQTQSLQQHLEKIWPVDPAERSEWWQHGTALVSFDGHRPASARLIFSRLAETWRARAPLFAEPITVGGTAIASLPPAVRKPQQECYELLGLGELPKRIKYRAYQAA